METENNKTKILLFATLSSLFLLLGAATQTLAQVSDMARIDNDHTKFDEDLAKCLCRASCNETWNCGVVSCLYAPEPSDESPDCADLGNGVCKCVGFGCGRVHINYSLEASQKCFEKYGNPLEGEELRSEQLRELDEAIQLARNQLLVAVKAQQSFKGREYDEAVETKQRELNNLIKKRLDERISDREDLSKEQKKIIQETTKKHLDSYKTVKAGEGSSVQTECAFWTFGCKEVLHIDPTSSVDIIYHELGHLIFEELSSKYEYPTGSSHHSFTGYSSTENRAFDEAIANIYALDLLGTHEYGSYSLEDEMSLHKLREKGDHEEGYRYNFAINQLFIAENDNSEEEIDVSANTRDSIYIKYYGVLNDSEREQHHRENIEQINERLERIKGEVIVLEYQMNQNPQREQYPSLYEERSTMIDPITGQEIQELKRLDMSKEDIEKRIEAHKRESAGLIRSKNLMQARLNPPAFSPRAELAVSRLIYETTGGREEIDRIGKIQEAVENFTKVKGRGPKNELEFLQGLLHGKKSDSPEFESIITIIQGDKLRRDYSIDQLILKQ